MNKPNNGRKFGAGKGKPIDHATIQPMNTHVEDVRHEYEARLYLPLSASEAVRLLDLLAGAAMGAHPTFIDKATAEKLRGLLHTGIKARVPKHQIDAIHEQIRQERK